MNVGLGGCRPPQPLFNLRSGTTNYAQLRLSLVRKKREGPELDALALQAVGCRGGILERTVRHEVCNPIAR